MCENLTAHRRHTKALETINTFCESLDLFDAWRVLNPDLFRFTWRRRRPEIHCRLDFFLVNQSAFCNTVEADIMPGYKSDHSLVTLKLSLHSNARGRGFWKLNTSLLNKTEFINQIKLTIQQTKDEFVDPKLLWEMIKMKVREESMKYGASKKKKTTKEQENIEQSIKSLENDLTDMHTDDSQKQKIWLELEQRNVN